MKLMIKIPAIFASLLFLFPTLASVLPLFSQASNQSVLDSLENALNKSRKDTTRLNLLTDLCVAYTHQDREKSIAYAEQCIALSKKIDDKETAAKCAMRRIYILNPPNLDEPVRELNEICKNTGDSLLMTNGHIYAGIAYWHHPKKIYDKAIGQFLQGLEYCKGKNNRSESICYINLYKIYGELKEYEKAIVFLEKGIALAEKNEDHRLMADSYSSLTELQKLMGETEKANEAALKALSAGEGKIDEADMIEVYINAGDALLNPISTEKYLKKGLELARKYQHTELMMKGFRQLSKFYLNNNKIIEAEQLTKESISLAEKHNEAFHLRFTYYEAAKVAEKRKDFETALEYYKKYNAWNDSVFVASKNKEIAEAEIKFETEKKELENNQLKEKAIILTNQNKTYTALAIFGFILAASALFFFFRTRRQKTIITSHNRNLAVLNNKLEKLNATKDRFFAIIAHDLRTPVLGFKGFTKTLKYLVENNEFERVKKIGNEIDEMANDLWKLLDNLLKWALLQKGAIPYNPKTINLNNIVEEAIAMQSKTAKQKGIKVENKIALETFANADPDAVFTIVFNLINNAIKFTDKNGKVVLSATTKNGVVHLEINDTGTGIAAHQLNSLFELDEEKRSRGTVGEKGAGLGLVLVKELVEINKGTIRAISEIGKGTSFVFALPSAN